MAKYLCGYSYMLGVVLPVLPATPFLLLTSWFLIRASPRLNEKLLRSRVFGPFLRDWATHHAVRPHVKLTAASVTVLGATGTLVFGKLPPAGVIALVVLAALALVVVLLLKVIREAP